MKHYLTLFIYLFFSAFCAAQVFDVETIKYEGDDDKHINLVILGDGYQTSELNQFVTDATSFTAELFNQSPFLEYSNYFNVYAIKVPSNESGADHPATATDVTEPLIPISTTDTYFNSTFDGFGFHRLLFYGIDWASSNVARLKIQSVLADNFPNYDQALILVNSTIYGGSGGEFPMSSTNISANEIAIHELGHSLFNLKDEYYPGDVRAEEAINMTKETSTIAVKWKNWINTNGVGVFQHVDSNGIPKDWYKPRQMKCKMEILGKPFCAVCKEGIIEKIHDLVSSVDSFTPDNSSNIENPSFPLDFELTLIKPNPNTLESTWTLNGSNIANNVDAISLLQTDLVDGNNTLSSVITDENPMLRVDNHNTTHVNTVTWTINYASLSIKDITSKTQNYDISVYPNPTENMTNFKIESSDTFNLKVKLMTLDGKLLKSFYINTTNQSINMSDLSSGIYIANFFANNALLTSRKIIKN